MKKICVYCGSRKPNDFELSNEVESIINYLTRAGAGIVYGGGKVGVMGLVANTALQNNAEVIGIIPESLKKAEVAHYGITKLIVTDSMHTRKAEMEKLSDAFLVLPGGFGTLDEFFEILTWKQLGIHTKPIILYNIHGYFDGLISFIDSALTQDFIRVESIKLLHTVSSKQECEAVFKKILEIEHQK